MKKIIQVYLAYKIIIRYTSKESFSQDTIINQQKEIHGDIGLIDFSQAKQAARLQKEIKDTLKHREEVLVHLVYVQ